MLKIKRCLYVIIYNRFFSITICNLLVDLLSYLLYFFFFVANCYIFSFKIFVLEVNIIFNLRKFKIHTKVIL